VQVATIKTRVESAYMCISARSALEGGVYDELFPNFACNFILRRCVKAWPQMLP